MNVPAFHPVPLRLPLSAVAALADVMARVFAVRSQPRRPAEPMPLGYGFRLRAPTVAARLRAALRGSQVDSKM
jgi:hypothetical protein